MGADIERVRNEISKIYGNHIIDSADCSYHLHIYMGVLDLKLIVDNETGEVIKIQDENEKTTELMVNAGVLDKEVYEIIDSMLYYQEQFETFKHKLEQAMKDNGIKKWETDYFTATVKDDYLQKRVDSERLKQDGIYEKYLKLVPTKGSLSIKFKKGV